MPELFTDPLLVPVVPIVIRLGLALLFFTAALHKTRYFQKYCADIRAYELLPNAWVPITATALTGFEWVLVFSLPAMGLTFPPLLAAILLAVYALAIAINLLRGRHHIDCGCYGPAKSNKDIQASTITTYLVARNVILASAALWCLTPAMLQENAVRDLVWLDLVVLPLSLVSLVILYQAIEMFFSQREAVRRFHQRTDMSATQ